MSVEFQRRSLTLIFQDMKVFVKTLKKKNNKILLNKEFHNLFLNHEGNLDKTPNNVAFDEMTYCWSKSVSGNRNFFKFFKI